MVSEQITLIGSVLFYVVCSGFMLLANKVVITMIPLPACIFSGQLMVAVVFVFVFEASGTLRADAFEFQRIKAFLPYIVLFVVSVYFNGRALARSNAETVIVFRASTPLFVSILDYAFLGRQAPSTRSLLSLLGVVIGAISYMLTDSEFQLNGLSAYGWVSGYTIAIVLEMTYGKKLVSFESSVWGSVKYTNALALLPMFVLALASGEVQRIQIDEEFELGNAQIESISVDGSHKLTPLALMVFMVSCAIGVAIGWSGWNCRNMVSATSFTLIGVVCKLITVIANVLIWNKHATPVGIFWLLVCLLSSSFYKQAPLRDKEEDTSTCPKRRESEEGIIYGVTNSQAVAPK